MVERQAPVRIAINVMRARLTVVGFNLAIITFQIGVIRRLPGAVQLPNADLRLHLATDVTLLMGLGLSVLAMVSFLASSAFDKEGTCTHWSLLAGDLLMYLGLAHSVAGFFGPLSHVFGQGTLGASPEAAELATVRIAVVTVGGLAWFSATYFGPLISLFRSPFGWRATTALGGAYLLLVLAVAHVSAQALRLDAARGGMTSGFPTTLFHELVQPLRW